MAELEETGFKKRETGPRSGEGRGLLKDFLEGQELCVFQTFLTKWNWEARRTG